MTEKQKKLAIIAGTIVIGLILLLYSRKAGSTIVNQQNMPPIQVSIPSLNIPDRSGIAINIPGLPSFSPYRYSAISPCMCNGAATTPVNNAPLIEFVNNAAGTGSNVYNYNNYSQPSYGGLGGAIWNGSSWVKVS